MKNNRNIQQKLGAVVNNKLGIDLKKQAELLLPHISRLGWYVIDSKEVIEPSLISYYFLPHTQGSIFFCVMKSNRVEVDYSLFECCTTVDEASYKLLIDEYVTHFIATHMLSDGNTKDPIMDLVVNLRSFKLSKLMDTL